MMDRKNGPSHLGESVQSELRTVGAKRDRSARAIIEAVYPSKGWNYSEISFKDDAYSGEPLYNSGKPPRKLQYGGKIILAHETNNLFHKLWAAKALKARKIELAINPDAPIYDSEPVYQVDDDILELFNEAENMNTSLFTLSMEIIGKSLEERKLGKFPIDLLTERDIQLSRLFELLSKLALAKDPSFDIQRFTS